MQKTLALLALAAASNIAAQEIVEATTEQDLFARDTYRIDSLVCPFKGSIEYDAGEIECGLLQVPENREDPNSRFIELHFVKLNSTWDDEEEEEDNEDEEWTKPEPGKRDDPVIYLTGGPGAEVYGYVDRFKDHGLRKHRDLYILEQRGIANSGNFCRKYYSRKPEVSNVDSMAKASEASLVAAEDCARNALAAGVDLSAYNTIENARDVKALRRALGYEQWNVWGISYGSILGQAYLKEDPEGILAAVIDAIVPLDTRADPITWRVTNWYSRDLDKLNELCQADSGCADNFPNLGERVRDAARASIDNSIAIEVEETEVYPSGTAYMHSDIATWLPFVMFYEQSNYPALPAMIDAWASLVESREEAPFKAIALGSAQGLFGGSQGMYDAIMCNDGFRTIAIESSRLDRAEFPLLTGAFGPEGLAEKQVQLCEDLGLSPRPRSDYAATETDIYTLIVEGDMDPITPPPLAHAILPGFSNGTYVEFPYAGHGPSRSVECAGDMLNLFYDNPSTDPDLTCVDEMEVPEFIGPLYQSTFGANLAMLALADKDDMPKVGAWFVFSYVPVVLAFLVLTFAPLVRRLDKRKAAEAGTARLATWVTAFFGTAAFAIVGIAMAMSAELNEFILLVGMFGWGVLGAWSGVLAGLSGIAAVALAIKARRDEALPLGSLVGFVLTGLAAVSLSAFMLTWGLIPW